jgi:SAM-dependent methyltransferase
MIDQKTSTRKSKILQNSITLSDEEERWSGKNRYFRKEHLRYLHFLVPEGLRVLDLGCGTGDLLASLKPLYGVGIDFNPKSIEKAQEQYPALHFFSGDIEQKTTLDQIAGTFDVIILSDVIGELDDIQVFLNLLHEHVTRDTRLVITYYNTVWEPFLKLAEKIRLKKPQVEQNWLSTADIRNIIELSGFEVIKQDWRVICPYRLLGLGHLVNRYIATLPLIRLLCLRNYAVARPTGIRRESSPSATVLIPCRNERGNIENALVRIPRFCDDMEIIYVEGHSSDGTLEEIHRMIASYSRYDIKVISQPGIGKADAVMAGFSRARGEILMILDADLTMPPEDLPKYYDAIVSGKGEFINGSRLVYPMEKEAMRFLNHMANRMFSILFTYLLNQRFTDTLCGTKALEKKYYQKIVANRSYFGDFDPFGDFDLIFGATKLNLKVVEIPIRYASRQYGTSQISRMSHGFLLIRMVVFAFRKLKAF